MRVISNISFAFTMTMAVVMSSSGAIASIECDNRQYPSGPVVGNPVSVEMTLPYGYLCHLVAARGKEISEQRAAYTSNASIYGPLVKDICNWRIDFVYYGTDGKEYLRDKGETVKDCKKGPSRILQKSKTLPQFGSTCVELIVDGKVGLTQCHSMKE